jgi:hypothetical protein
MNIETIEEVFQGHRKDGLVMVYTDNGCGDTVTMVFLESEEIK